MSTPKTPLTIVDITIKHRVVVAGFPTADELARLEHAVVNPCGSGGLCNATTVRPLVVTRKRVVNV